ncbi:helix-turn-helix domain-containing protein [Pseudomonas shirazica]
MLLDMLAAVARKDYEDRKRRTAEGREKAKANGLYKGRPVDQEKHRRIQELLAEGKSVRKIADLLGCSTQTVSRSKKSSNLAALEKRPDTRHQTQQHDKVKEQGHYSKLRTP